MSTSMKERHIGFALSWATQFTASGFMMKKFSPFKPRESHPVPGDRSHCFRTGSPLPPLPQLPSHLTSYRNSTTPTTVMSLTLVILHTTFPSLQMRIYSLDYGLLGGGNALSYLWGPAVHAYVHEDKYEKVADEDEGDEDTGGTVIMDRVLFLGLGTAISPDACTSESICKSYFIARAATRTVLTHFQTGLLHPLHPLLFLSLLLLLAFFNSQGERLLSGLVEPPTIVSRTSVDATKSPTRHEFLIHSLIPSPRASFSAAPSPSTLSRHQRPVMGIAILWL
ncbi:hypothetical protein DL96DRAFT_1821759 [Flagelloscypha sp. PMI_526]|nr:hypothetical protein DL96DRAFT_1821759 [Flagelloscypha sp. PMI_526]